MIDKDRNQIHVNFAPPISGRFFLYKNLFDRLVPCAIFHCMEPFVDAHCHFSNMLAEYSGAGRFICNATREQEWNTILDASRINNSIVPAVGIHPWYVDGVVAGWQTRMRRMIMANPFVMVGEIGLDGGHEHMDLQYSIFSTQYEIAANLMRTVHIHCMRAWDKMFVALKTLPAPPRIVFHRFSGGAQILSDLCRISDGVYFSYRDVRGGRQRNAIAQTPLNRMLVETDGNVPNPSYISNVIREIADIHGVPPVDMANIIYTNSQQVINNGQIA